MIKETDIKWLESILKATPEALQHIADNKSVAQNLFDAFSCLLIGEDIAKQLSYDRREDNIAGTNSLFWRHLIGIVLYTTTHFISFVICLSVALGNRLCRCSNIRSNDS